MRRKRQELRRHSYGRAGGLTCVATVAVVLCSCGGHSTTSAALSRRSSPTTTSSSPPSTAPTSTDNGSTTSVSDRTTPSSTSTSIASSGCASAHLEFSLSPPNAGAGSFLDVLSFTNVGSAPCTLEGFPGVSFLNSSGSEVGQPAVRTAATPAFVSLTPGGKAYAELQIPDPPAVGCVAGVPSEVRVYPPGQTAPLTAPAYPGTSVCVPAKSGPGEYSTASIGPITSTPGP